MSTQVQIYDDGENVAAADYSTTGQYLAVVQSTAAAGKVVLASVSGAPILGVLQNNPVAGGAAQVRILGRTKWVAGAAIPFGSPVMSNGSGQCIALATTGSTAAGTLSENIAVTGVGQIVSVILIPYAGTK